MNIILIIIFIAIMLILAWAIFSNKPEPVVQTKTEPPKPEIDEPERILRRRSSDKAIEKEYPAERINADTAAENLYDKEDITGQIKLPFPPNDIIPDGSRFKLYKRALINSEIYAKRGDIETAISLFNGVKERILDYDIRSKIESDINYLNHFRHRRDADFKKRVESASSPLQPGSGELRLRIDGPVPQTINIGLPEKNAFNADEIVHKLSDQITRELGNLKNDIERLKSKPEEKLDLDDFEEFNALQQEFKNLKKQLQELTDERINTLKELNDLRELKFEELQKEFQKDQVPENKEILQEIRKDIDNLLDLRHSLDSLHNKIEGISALSIPESKTQPTIVQAKFDAPLTEQADEIPEEEKEKPVSPEVIEELSDKINEIESKYIEQKETIKDLTKEVAEKESIKDLLEQITQKLYNDDSNRENKAAIETEEEFEEYLRPSDDEAQKDQAATEQILKSALEKEREKEIQKHIDAEEDPNAFDLVSDIGKVKDDSTLTDEDIFEKILKDEKNKNDDSAFEILGDRQKEDNEITFNNSILQGKMKAEQDFYKKFIKADRILKKELPILKVSYDFKKLPEEFSLSREKNILEYSFYKYRPMLAKADEYIKDRHVKDAINYYKVVLDQNIPIEFKAMIKKNIRDLTEYLEKYLSSD